MQEGVNEYIGTITPIEASDIITERMVLMAPDTDLSTSTKVIEDASGDGMAQAGEILTFTITITNSGTAGAAIMLVDELPMGLTYVEGSLDWSFPGTAGLFDATFEDNVLTAQTLGFGSLMTPDSGSLLPASVATITFAAQVCDTLPKGGQFANEIELQDQYLMYEIPPAVIAIEYQLYLPYTLKGYAAP
jgi:uncharacterized repeat protein (TIGR01451 family)